MNRQTNNRKSKRFSFYELVLSAFIFPFIMYAKVSLVCCDVVLGGPKAACVGCAGFAAFSVVIEKFLERHQ